MVVEIQPRSMANTVSAVGVCDVTVLGSKRCLATASQAAAHRSKNNDPKAEARSTLALAHMCLHTESSWKPIRRTVHLMKNYLHELAYVLHRYDWSESSLILEVFTRQQGRVALVAKGVKRPSSQFRAILLPLQLLSISFGGDAQVRTLKSAEWQGGLTMPSGDALLSGYYLNELLMKLLARDDPHDLLFDAYAQACAGLRDVAQLDACLRAFELVLLREIGLLPALDRTSFSGTALQEHALYSLVPDMGLRAAQDAHDPQAALSASAWYSLQKALDERAALLPVRAAVQGMSQTDKSALKRVLRSLLNYHAGSHGFQTRKLMMDAQALG
jgi:DNA repair protein RecO (recombination protein O)